MENEKLKLSILIAAYNVEKYIGECLESVINQTMKDIEIVVVNDASTDSTPEILRRYAEKDSRIKVVSHEVNKGLATVRKTALAASTGEYIMNLDGDDYFSLDACEKAYNAIVSENSDILQFGITPFSENENDFEKEKNGFDKMYMPAAKLVYTDSETGILCDENLGKRFPITVWNKIYKREIVEKIEASIPDRRINMAEDVMYVFFALYHSHTYAVLDEKLINYRIGSGMSTGKRATDFRIKSTAEMYSLYEYIEKWTEEQGTKEKCERILEAIKYGFLSNITDLFVKICTKEQQKIFIKEIVKYCPLNEFISFVFKSTVDYKNFDIADVADAFLGIEEFSPVRKEVKTIAAYYNGMYGEGIGKTANLLIDMWVKNGYNVVLFTDEETDETDINPSVKRVIIPQVKQGKYDRIRERVNAWQKYTAEYDIDIMVYNAWRSSNLMFDELAVKSCGVPFIVHTDGVFCEELDNEFFEYSYGAASLYKVLRLSDMVTVLNTVDEAWWKALGIKCMKTVNPMQFDFSEKPAALSGNNILMSTRISRENGIIDAIRIFDIVHRNIPEAVLTIAGMADDKEYEKEVLYSIDYYKLNDFINLAGYRTDMIDFYKNSDVMLCTSKNESLCQSLAESKMFGLPVVTYELPDLDMIRQEKGMFVVPQGDIETAAQCIIKILRDENLKKELGRLARESAEDFFRIDLVKHWNTVFEETFKPEEEIPMYKKSPLETAVGLMNDKNIEGMYRRSKSSGGGKSGDLIYYKNQCNALNDTINELRNSTSYRLGSKIISIPSKIKNIFRKK